MQKENQRVIISKRMLKEGLLRLLEKKNIDKINVSELCQEAGINRATFYRHYETPHDVLMELETEFFKKIYLFPNSPQTVEESENYVRNLCTYLYEHANLVKIFIRNNTDKDFAHLLNDFYQNILESGTDFSSVDAMDSEDLKLMATYLAGGGYYVLRRWLMEDIQKTPDEIAALMLKLFKNDLLLPR